jgi:hypothetical protein
LQQALPESATPKGIFLKFNPIKIAGDIDAGDNAVSPELYSRYAKNLRQAVKQGTTSQNQPTVKTAHGEMFENLVEQFDANVARFAAAKSYVITQAIRGLEDDDPSLPKPRTRLEKQQRLLTLAEQYQATEAATAAKRTYTARKFIEDLQPNRMKLFPNRKWLPSVSQELRPEHKQFYNRVWAKTDPFWDNNQPGTLWNCKCRTIETADPVTEGNDELPEAKLPDSLAGNPIKTGEIFSHKTSWNQKIKNKDIQVDSQTQKIFPNLKDLLSHKAHIWHAGYYTDNDGWLFTDRERIKQAATNKQETAKYNREYSQCQTLAKNGYKVEYLKDIEKSFDIYLNGVPADLKKTSSHNNIVKDAKHATKNQGAKIVVFEFEKETKEIYTKLQYLIKEGIHGKYFFSDNKNKVHDF